MEQQGPRSAGGDSVTSPQRENENEGWVGVGETALHIAGGFLAWMGHTISGPIAELSVMLDDILIPTPLAIDDAAHGEVGDPYARHTEFGDSSYSPHFPLQGTAHPNERISSRGERSTANAKNWGKLGQREAGRATVYSSDPRRERNSEVPQSFVPDIGQDTRCYATKSHAILTVHRIENIGKILESSITYGDFRLKGPGFRLVDVRIPIRKGFHQVISIVFKAYESSWMSGAGHKHASESIQDYRIDIPLSIINQRVSKHWVTLSPGGELYRMIDEKHMMPEALYLMQDDDNQIRIHEPRMCFTLIKCMQGIHEITTGRTSGDFEVDKGVKQRIYIGHFDDPIDISVAMLLRDMKEVLDNEVFHIERTQHSGKYYIDGVLCEVSLDDGVLIMHEGGAHQPLKDYLEGSSKNLSWDQPSETCAIDLVNAELLPSLQTSVIPWEATVDRRKAMELACHRVAVREKLAIETLKYNGLTPPKAQYSQYLEPPIIRCSPSDAGMPMTYTWGKGYTDQQLVSVDELEMHTSRPQLPNPSINGMKNMDYNMRYYSEERQETIADTEDGMIPLG